MRIYKYRHSYVVMLILVVGIYACATLPKSTQRSPGKSVKLWNNALYEGNVERAKILTSESSKEYMRRSNGIEGLSKIYQRSKNKGVSHKIESVVINNNSATVIYITGYEDGTIKKWTDKLFKEDGIWKVAPQYVKSTVIKKGKN